MMPWCCASCCEFFFFFSSFLAFFCAVFPLFPFWPLLQYPTILLVLPFFLVLPCAYESHAIYTCLGGTWAPLSHTIFPNMICGGHVPTSASLSVNLSPPHSCQKHVLPPIFASACLVLRLLGANASPCTHPNPSPSF